MKVEIVKITAIGSNLRLATLKINDFCYYTFRISNEFYKLCKSCYVPTAQYLRYHKTENG